ncbi:MULTISPECIES: hypothetical protein [Acidovorax]|uniref:Uncharacterized protein n=1 Tax=Acidovorax facilis TaxID=12917 RepID=A0ABV8DCL3_9BURK|nr:MULTISPECIES: hypothetical protein [Acidovorax]KQB59247.1 hypothetical protein AE621_11105 [Acidovorax sp. SD340]MBO1007507.1 hypothetical protein [Acidovorax sp. SD340]MCO4241356.1 hypothetical protein [Acidovorax facilis]
MKKFAMAAVAAAALSAGVAQAYTVGTYSNGFVVPNVVHNGDADTTAVGIVNQTGNTVPVFWTFFDANSNHVTDGCFPMTNKDFEPFVWSQQSGNGLSGVRGYLVFAVGANTANTSAATACNVAAATAGAAANGQIGASAFQVTTGTQDVAYVPVIDGPLNLVSGSDLTILGPNSLLSVGGARAVGATASALIPPQTPNPSFSMRYAIDNTANAGLETRIVVWSTGDQRGTHTVNMYDAAQNRKSVNFALAEAELSFFNPETIPGRPANFGDGFIEWAPMSAEPADYPGTSGQSLFFLGGSVFTYSVINMPAFGAIQSILGTHN